MKIVLHIFTVSIILFSSFVFGNDGKSDKELLNDVIKDFQTSISEKDEKRFLELFYDHTVVFLGTNPDKRLGSEPSNNGLMYSTHVGFIGWIVSSSKDVEEKIWDVIIKTDGNIASIYFTYSFHVDKTKTNWGDEQWSLIKIGDDWKIVSVLYTAKY
jgi:ketosteroid isomerase-like protein